MTYKVAQGDVLDTIKEIEDNEVDAVFCDPPYGLNFMNKRWDHGVPSAEVWAEILRVSKPGAWLLAFGGTRMHHRLMVNIEDAGWEIRDCMMWVYGSGFPKSYNISKGIDKHLGKERPQGDLKTNGRGKWDLKVQREKGDTGVGHADGSKQVYHETLAGSEEAEQWEGYGTALKPAFEPIIVARKPVKGNNVKNCLEYGCGGLNIDGCRIGTETIKSNHSAMLNYGGENSRPYHKDHKNTTHKHQGRWPANFLHDGSEEVLELFPDTKSGKNAVRKDPDARGYHGNWGCGQEMVTYADYGSAARFFYTAKVSPKERNVGLGKGENNHPTLKPISLCEYLATLVLPPERETKRKILVPFAGTGSEMAGAIRAGWDLVYGIELEEEYCTVAERRIPALVELKYKEKK